MAVYRSVSAAAEGRRLDAEVIWRQKEPKGAAVPAIRRSVLLATWRECQPSAIQPLPSP